MGNCLVALDKYEDATFAFERSAELLPDHAQAWYNLGVTRTVLQRVDAALEAYEHSVRINPRYTEAHNNRGILLQALGRYEEAESSYTKALAADPNYLNAAYNSGALFQLQDRLPEAIERYRSVIRCRPDHVEAHNNLGNTLFALNRTDEALAAYKRAVQLDGGNAQAHWNLALAYLLTGDFRRGWREYEWRLRQPGASPRAFRVPLWDGSPLDGRRILLHSEQGYGDTIQFVRYASLVKSAGGRIILECQPALVRLLARMPDIEMAVARGQELPEFDCHAPLLSVPRLFSAIPAKAPYLDVDPALLDRWRSKVPDGGTRVGIAWAGNPGHLNDRKRSIPFALMSELMNTPGVRFVGLQKDSPGLASELDDFADTAAVIAHLDMVVSVDTAVAHLGGAMGKPVWTLLPFAPDWRWMLNRDDTPWYPTMRLFRQPAPGDWTSVLARVRQELSAKRRST
jgi:Flp pilus assembly protein TadD